ncbi:MAG: cold-shock protein [Mesorhizobium sp.]|nr:MAG: cold-shock protein [Mesorhizobium sp.]
MHPRRLGQSHLFRRPAHRLGGGPEVFVHISAVERAGLSTLLDGQKINCEIGQARRTARSSAGSLGKLRLLFVNQWRGGGNVRHLILAFNILWLPRQAFK